MEMELQSVMDRITFYLTTYGMSVIGAIIILILGRIGAGIGRSIVGRILNRYQVDCSIVSFTRTLTFTLILIFAVLAALSNFGIQTTSIVAVLGAATFAVGFALKDSLSDFAAGILLLVLQPFKGGDYIEAGGTAGTVKEMSLFTTVLTTPDNIKIMVPNSKIFGDTIKNYTANDTRRLDMTVGIGYGSSVDEAVRILTRLLEEDERVLKDPEPQIAVANLADSSVNIVVRPWVNKGDYWPLKFDLNRRIKAEFDAGGIEIPFPQVTVHMSKEA